MRVVCAFFALTTFGAVLTGCASAPADYKAVWCLTNMPWRPAAAEYAHYERTAKERMAAHNEQGTEWCKWKY